MQCIDFIGNPFYLAYLVNERETFPDCTGSFLFDELPVTNPPPSEATAGTIAGEGEASTLIVFEAPEPFQLSDIDPQTASEAYTAGLLLALGPLFIVYSVRSLLGMIRKH